MQRVVYSGMFLNEVPRIDIAQSTFTADLYLWMRYARVTAADADPGDIQFPTLLRGNFDPSKPAAQGELDDGTVYRSGRFTATSRTISTCIIIRPTARTSTSSSSTPARHPTASSTCATGGRRAIRKRRS